MVGNTVVVFSKTVMLVVTAPPVYGQDAENPGLHTHLSTPTWAGVVKSSQRHRGKTEVHPMPKLPKRSHASVHGMNQAGVE